MAEENMWTTIHTENRMIHDFGCGYLVVVDKTTNRAEKQFNGHYVDHFDITGMLLETFEQILFNFSKTIQNN